jgi:hypothetical protein
VERGSLGRTTYQEERRIAIQHVDFVERHVAREHDAHRRVGDEALRVYAKRGIERVPEPLRDGRRAPGDPESVAVDRSVVEIDAAHAAAFDDEPAHGAGPDFDGRASAGSACAARCHRGGCARRSR